MKLNGRSIFKGIVKFVGSMGVGALVSLGVKQNIIPVSKYDKIMCAIGSFVLSDMISTKAEEYLDQQCDSVFDTVDSVKNILGEVQDEETKEADDTIITFEDEVASFQEKLNELKKQLVARKNAPLVWPAKWPEATTYNANGEETSWPKEI